MLYASSCELHDIHLLVVCSLCNAAAQSFSGSSSIHLECQTICLKKWSLAKPAAQAQVECLCTLKYRRLRGDMIEVSKIIKHKYDYYKVAPELIYNINSNESK